MLPIHSHTLPGHNQEIYQQLQDALSSTPPHQLWIAICDDLPLQRQLAATVETDVQEPSAQTTTQLFFQAESPNLVQQLRDWAQRVPSPKPQLLQILGIEQLTYQGADQQYQFLRSLRGLHPFWPQLGCSLLIWLPRPWLKQVRRAVPTLCRTVFEFIGEPTPLPARIEAPSRQATFSSQQWHFLDNAVLGLSTPSHTDVSEATVGANTQSPATDLAESATDNPEIADPAAQIFSDDLWNELQTGTLSTDEASLFLPLPLPDYSATSDTDTSADTSADTSLETAASAVSESAPGQVFPIEPSPAEATPDPDAWALAYKLRDQVQAGDASEATLSQAIRQYEALQPKAQATPHRIEALNDLGSLYWLWSQYAADMDIYRARLSQSCGLYEAALSPVDPGADSEILARLHSNLGSVYSLLAGHQNAAHFLDKAIRSFHRALQYTPLETLPGEYATLQTHLGTAYWSLAQQTRKPAQLHRAISAYQEALQHSQPQSQPQPYAQLLNNLGIALWSLARYERPVFLLGEAVKAYRGALIYRTLEADPAGCAATHNNLGTAFWDLGGHSEEKSEAQISAWRQAAAAYEQALSAAQQVAAGALGFDLWATHHSVGVVFDQLAIAAAPDTSVQQANFVKAVGHYVQALTGWRTLEAAAAETALQALVRNLHLQNQHLGIEGQQQSLAQIPAEWLPEIWRKLR